jgi:4-amino-4-deoxy-L-arabinose transferase-like glycosyltransferase
MPTTSTAPRIRYAVLAALSVGIFVASWLFRFNDPSGSFAGLTDDHFFYIVRGWQILFGDLPVRDFVDHGAPLYYYLAAAVQVLFGRGTLSELAFSTTALSVSAVLTFLLATRASGSIVAGLAACLLHVWLGPRFYNYPKILVYAVAIALLWRFADRPSAHLRVWLAVVTVIGFLFRHDHGVFVGIASAVLMLSLTEMRLGDRVRHLAIYTLLAVVLVAPYFFFIQMNGGLVSYFRQASAWAERDRARETVVWPGLFDNPDGVSEAAQAGSPVAAVRDNADAWLYYFELALPFFALFVIASSRDGFRPEWPHAREKLAMVAVLGAVLDAGFLRSPLEARLADPSVPLVILLAWLMAALPRMILSDSSLRPSWLPLRWPLRAAVSLAGVAIAMLLVVLVSGDLYRRLDKASMTDRFGKAFERASAVAGQLRLEWDIGFMAVRPDRPELMTLSLYLNACTAPTDRILIQSYLPQVLAVARRAFAGGHADLRPGFFEAEDAQRLTTERLRRQSVPIILLDTDDSLRSFYRSFPIVTAFIDQQYRQAGTHTFDERFGLTLYVKKDRTPTGTWEPLGWPCFGSGQNLGRGGSGGRGEKPNAEIAGEQRHAEAVTRRPRFARHGTGNSVITNAF